MNPNHDTSTINTEELNKLPVYKKPGNYHLQKDPGNGCFLDPPGYPTYFTQSVYTRNGELPENGMEMVIFGHTIASSKDYIPARHPAEHMLNRDEVQEVRRKRIRNLWLPLPLDHPRTRAWIEQIYGYFHNCYHDETMEKSDKTMIYPVPDYELKRFTDDPRFSDEWRDKEKKAIAQANKEIIEHAEKIAIPENHKAVRLIRQFYPEYEPEPELIKNPLVSTGNWWERYSVRPKPEECPGEYGQKHPVNGSWCQMCGWRPEKEEKT